MKLTQTLSAALLAAMLFPRVSSAADTRQSLTLIPKGAASPVDFKAFVFEGGDKFLRARGNVLLLSGDRKITASELRYDWSKGTAELHNATFTTCTASKPDYRIEAESVTLIPPNRVRARRVALFLGGTRVLMLPSVKVRIGGKKASSDIFPRPSYDKEGGVALAQRFPLVDSDRAVATADIRVSTKNGVEGDFTGAFGFDGVLTEAPVQPLSFPAFRTKGLAIPIPVHTSNPSYDAEPTHPTRLRGFLRVSSHLRTYNAHNPDLLVYRRPEIGLSYVARPINVGAFTLDPRLPTSPVANLSWGRFTEAQGAGPLNCASYGFVVPINVASIGETTVIQPTFQFSQSSYQSGTTYTWAAASLGVSHLRPDGTLEALRYIKRGQRGTTPFQFDQLFVLDEIQGAIQFQKKTNLMAFVSGYNLRNGAMYDWSVLLGHKTDCLAVSLSWSNLERKVLFNVHILSK